MKAKTVQIIWHSKEPVFSVDFHQDGTLVTGGGDKDIKVATTHDGAPTVNFICSLTGHSKTVNCVRFSPTGEQLASAGDDGEIILWRPAPAAVRSNLQSQGDAPLWKMAGTLRGHFKDVQDLAWSPDSSALFSGSIENDCIVFDAQSTKPITHLRDHKHYVHGVTWDPRGEYLVTQSVDRTVRIYAPKPPGAGKKVPIHHTSASWAKDVVCQHIVKQGALQPKAGAQAAAADVDPSGAPVVEPKPQKQPLFQDEDLPTFFRRLAWSPDGIYKQDSSAPALQVAHVFARGDWQGPTLALPSLSKPTVAVRFNPVIYAPRAAPAGDSTAAGGTSSSSSMQSAPYRLVYAVATMDSVLIYDTQDGAPLIILGSLHFAPITDLAWSADGRLLVVASHDGYCSVAAFEAGELGRPLTSEQVPAGVRALLDKRKKQQPPTPTSAAVAPTVLKSASPAASTQLITNKAGGPAAAVVASTPPVPQAPSHAAVSSSNATAAEAASEQQHQHQHQQQFIDAVCPSGGAAAAIQRSTAVTTAGPATQQRRRLQPQLISPPAAGLDAAAAPSPRPDAASLPAVRDGGSSPPGSSGRVGVKRGSVMDPSPSAPGGEAATAVGGAAGAQEERPAKRRIQPIAVTAFESGPYATPALDASGQQQTMMPDGLTSERNQSTINAAPAAAAQAEAAASPAVAGPVASRRRITPTSVSPQAQTAATPATTPNAAPSDDNGAGSASTIPDEGRQPVATFGGFSIAALAAKAGAEAAARAARNK